MPCGRGGKAKTHTHLSLLVPSLRQPRILLEDEEINYKTAKDLAGYHITAEPDLRVESEDE